MMTNRLGKRYLQSNERAALAMREIMKSAGDRAREENQLIIQP